MLEHRAVEPKRVRRPPAGFRKRALQHPVEERKIRRVARAALDHDTGPLRLADHVPAAALHPRPHRVDRRVDVDEDRRHVRHRRAGAGGHREERWVPLGQDPFDRRVPLLPQEPKLPSKISAPPSLGLGQPHRALKRCEAAGQRAPDEPQRPAARLKPHDERHRGALLGEDADRSVADAVLDDPRPLGLLVHRRPARVSAASLAPRTSRCDSASVAETASPAVPRRSRRGRRARDGARDPVEVTRLQALVHGQHQAPLRPRPGPRIRIEREIRDRHRRPATGRRQRPSRGAPGICAQDSTRARGAPEARPPLGHRHRDLHPAHGGHLPRRAPRSGPSAAESTCGDPSRRGAEERTQTPVGAPASPSSRWKDRSRSPSGRMFQPRRNVRDSTTICASCTIETGASGASSDGERGSGTAGSLTTRTAPSGTGSNLRRLKMARSPERPIGRAESGSGSPWAQSSMSRAPRSRHSARIGSAGAARPK